MLCTCFLVLVLVSGLHAKGQRLEPRPNLLLLVADDMGWGDLGINVPHLPSNTPHLDSLARHGLRLTDFHSGASLCTPSRAALLTGRMGLRTGVINNFATESVAGLPRNETTLAELLRQVGYRTAMFGKWHLGTRPGYHPLDRGFQHYLGVPYSLDMGCTTPAGADLPARDACPRHWQNNEVDGEGGEERERPQESDESAEPLALPLYENRRISHQPVKLKSLAKYYASFGDRFISANSTEPFFLYAAFSHVHVPLACGNRFKNATGRGLFADVLAEMDWVVAKLIRAAAKREEPTLTWFLSDNGPWDVKCFLAGNSGPFKGGWQRNVSAGGGGSAAKTTVWEAGHRVPSILHWPKKIKGGEVSDALLSALDVFPTFAALAGAPLPKYRVFDGINLMNDLLHKRNLTGHQELFHPNSGSSGPIGDIGAVRVGQYKTTYYAGGTPACLQVASRARKLAPPLAFDLDTDPTEKYPITDFAQSNIIVKQANEALERFLRSVREDNTTEADYRKDASARPCCDAMRVACACPWDNEHNLLL